MKKGVFWVFVVSATVAGWCIVAGIVLATLTLNPPLISGQMADVLRKWIIVALSISGLIAGLTFRKEHAVDALKMFQELIDRLLGR